MRARARDGGRVRAAQAHADRLPWPCAALVILSSTVALWAAILCTARALGL